MVKKVVEEELPEKGEIKIVTTPTNDMRSYHVNSDKIKRVLGFKPKRSIEDAVRDLTRAFRNHLHAEQLRRRLVLQRPHHEEARSEMSATRRSRSSPAAPASSAATWSTCCSSAAIACA